MVNRLILGESSQTLRHVPMGPVSAASFTFEDLNYSIGDASRVIASGEVTPPSWSLTSTAIAGPTQVRGERISVGSTTGASIGARATITAPDGTRELFEIVALSTDSYVEAASTLAGVYPIGSTIEGVELSVSVPDDFVSGAGAEDRLKQQHALRVTWEYTLDGRAYKLPELVTWARHAAQADQLAGEAVVWLSKMYPDLRERRPEGADLDAVAALLSEEIFNDLKARLDKDPSTFLVGDSGRALLVARILAHLGELGYSPGTSDQSSWAARAATKYRERFDDLTVGVSGQGTATTAMGTDTAQGTPDTTYRHIFRQM